VLVAAGLTAAAAAAAMLAACRPASQPPPWLLASRALARSFRLSANMSLSKAAGAKPAKLEWFAPRRPVRRGADCGASAELVRKLCFAPSL